MATECADEYYQGGQQDQRYPQQSPYENQVSQGPVSQYQQYRREQQYQQPTPVPPQPAVNINEKPDFNQTFRINKPRYNDIWAALLFLATFAGFVVVSGFAINAYSKTMSYQGGTIYGGSNTVGLSTNTVILFAFVLGVAFALSLLYFWTARTFTKEVIWITGILQMVFGIGTAITYYVRHQFPAAIVFTVFTVFYIVCFISWIPRIPFSVLMLQTTIDVSKSYGHIFLVSFIGGLLATAFGAWFSVTLVAVYAKYEPGPNPSCGIGIGGCSTATVIGLVVFITFSGYWASEVLKNTMHATIAGVYGSWYFCSQKPGGFPKGATRGAFRRSVTYSFGSISFGSLLVAIVQFLRHVCSVAQQNQAATGNFCGEILFCFLGCFLWFLEWAVQFLNEYAFSYIALYGKAFVPAAKTTWAMMKDRGLDALVNDCLVNPVLSMGSVFVAYVCTFLAYLYIEFTKPGYNSTGSFTPVVMAYAFLIGLQICNIFLVPIRSGVSTLFVAMAFDPEVLINDFPDLYAKLVRVYPHIQQAIHV